MVTFQEPRMYEMRKKMIKYAVFIKPWKANGYEDQIVRRYEANERWNSSIFVQPFDESRTPKVKPTTSKSTGRTKRLTERKRSIKIDCRFMFGIESSSSNLCANRANTQRRTIFIVADLDFFIRSVSVYLSDSMYGYELSEDMMVST